MAHIVDLIVLGVGYLEEEDPLNRLLLKGAALDLARPYPALYAHLDWLT